MLSLELDTRPYASRRDQPDQIGVGSQDRPLYRVVWTKGIASVLYLLMAIIELGIEGLEQVGSIITLTVLLSIFLHGVSAVPLSGIFKRKYCANPTKCLKNRGDQKSRFFYVFEKKLGMTEVCQFLYRRQMKKI